MNLVWDCPPHEQKKVFLGLTNLRKLGNTVLVIDHANYFQKKSDYFISMGPGAGKFGGEIIYKGKFSDFEFT